MGRFDGCLLASDIDGTLLESGYINPRNIEKIDYFVKEGGSFCLCTGRSIGAISTVLDAVKNTEYSVVANGCMVFCHAADEIAWQVFVPETDRAVVKAVYDNLPEIGIEIHSEGDVFTLRQTARTDLHQKYEGLPTKVLDFNEVLEYNWNKVLFALESVEQYDEISALTDGMLSGAALMVTATTIGGEKQNYFELLPKGVSKIKGLKKLCEIAKVKEGGLFAIGDYYNDLEMIKNADISAVTSGTPDDIKPFADFIAGSCSDGAVADFIDYLSEVVKKPKG